VELELEDAEVGVGKPLQKHPKELLVKKELLYPGPFMRQPRLCTLNLDTIKHNVYTPKPLNPEISTPLYLNKPQPLNHKP